MISLAITFSFHSPSSHAFPIDIVRTRYVHHNLMFYSVILADVLGTSLHFGFESMTFLDMLGDVSPSPSPSPSLQNTLHTHFSIICIPHIGVGCFREC